jgi:hypothetical protein
MLLKGAYQSARQSLTQWLNAFYVILKSKAFEAKIMPVLPENRVMFEI